ANPTNPAIKRLPGLIRRNSPLGYLDIDLGHPWKTDVFDIYDRLTAANFEPIQFHILAGSYLDNTRTVAEYIGTVSAASGAESEPAQTHRRRGILEHAAKLLGWPPSVTEAAIKF